MSGTRSLTNFTAFCNRGMSPFRQPASSLVRTALLGALFGQALLFCQTIPQASCINCCAGRPAYTGIPGQMAVATQFASGEAATLGNRDVVIWNISPNPVYPAPNTDWAPKDQFYSDARWNPQNLGDVFGLTLDNAGNIFVATTTIYGSNRVGTLPFPGISYAGVNVGGQIYKIDRTTGEPKGFVRLNNPHNVGLGNITYDCGHSGFYVSNFDDGLIYHLDASGNTLNTWDHGANLSSATDLKNVPLARPNIPPYSATCHVLPDGTPCGYDSLGYAKLGRRPWAVHVYQNRLYYSIWSMDYAMNQSHGTLPNEIWSIALGPSGNFIGSARLEITMPLLSATDHFNNPVSDLTFSPMGTMIVAERTMLGDHQPTNQPAAHNSRVLEFGFFGSAWVVADPLSYQAGCYDSGNGYPTNSAGGVDFDLTPVGVNNKFQVWATGDILHYNSGSPCSTVPGAHSDFVYGLQGFPANSGPGAPGTIANSILIDLNDYNLAHNKMEIGDVKIPCPLPPSTVLSDPPGQLGTL